MILQRPPSRFLNRIFTGNCMDAYQKIPEQSLSCIVTSPPYWNARDYKTDPQTWGGTESCHHEWAKTVTKGMSGGENSDRLNRKGQQNFQIVPDTEIHICTKCGAYQCELGRENETMQYIHHLCDVFDAAHRTLRDDGSLFVNLGDKYAVKGNTLAVEDSLLLIPTRFAEEMTRRGWCLRNVILWIKSNPMPTPIVSRFTIDFEYVFWFVKSTKTMYWINTHTRQLVHTKPIGLKGVKGTDWNDFPCIKCHGIGYIRTKDGKKQCKSCKGKKSKPRSLWEGHKYYFKQIIEPLKHPKGKATFAKKKYEGIRDQLPTYSGMDYDASMLRGKNKRAVWVIATQSLKYKHFAPFPIKLVEIPLEAACPEKICTACGAPQFEVWEKQIIHTTNGDFIKPVKIGMSECGCNAPYVTGVMNDPFGGSGTVAIAASKHARDYVLFELNPEYVQIAKERLSEFCNTRLDDFGVEVKN